ncbi:hypothetical protein FHR88_000790 [Bradyrhizobium betae]|uniref:Uncharacterized protein n=1 Tax=Bradyrhizobium betae TaxID=244734 RepID=A0A5P6NXZ2_9BRAD|nr:hypothetical protein [Bradyrhizobium betae]QFI70977.1 hypothetical protein F8237_00475 [Bradyrhizobium betae]
MFDLRTVVIAASFILASIAVAAAEGAQQQPPAPRAETAGEARPIRVVLPAPWQTAAPEARSPLPLR